MTLRKVGTQLPDFIIGGAQKSGSSWLANHLRSHPDIFLQDKELDFFSIDRRYERGIGWYESQFSAAREDQIIGEKSPSYMRLPLSSSETAIASRIREALPEIKLFFILRNPVDRAFSAVKHHMFNRRIPPTENIEEILFGKFSETTNKWNIITFGYYDKILMTFYDNFEDSQIKIFIFEEDVLQNPRQMLDSASEFLGIEKFSTAREVGKEANKGLSTKFALAGNYKFPALNAFWQGLDRLLPSSAHLRMSNSCRARLSEIYRPHNERLFRLIGRSPASWSASMQ